MLKSILSTTLNVLFPSSCVGCKTKHVLLCEKCIVKIPEPVREINATSIFSYRDEVIKKALWEFKYRKNKDFGKIFARSLYDKILEEISEEEILSNFHRPLLVPIPLSKKRLGERGFNQSELIAYEISLLDNDTSFIFNKDVLEKIKDTPSQVSIKDKNSRLKNLNGCFSVKDKKCVDQKNIILIDDITTTGATIKEAEKTLMNAGAKKVISFTVAH